MNKSVWVGMSGGVDSSVAALLLQRQGYDVTGITLDLLESGSAAADDAARVCEALAIPHHVVNLREQFKSCIIDYFAESYMAGNTPNPCIQCNSLIKFGAMLHYAREHGADMISTGHYVNLEFDTERSRYILRASASVKDQSYFLYRLTQEQLKHCVFPLADMEKQTVRQLAANAGLPTAVKSDSMEICFVPRSGQRGNHAEFIEQYLDSPLDAGDFVDASGKVLGQHGGVARYTVGQRKGLGIALHKPMFVTGINAKNNTVTLGDSNMLMHSRLELSGINCVAWEKLPEHPTCVTAKIRYHAPCSPAVITAVSAKQAIIEFRQPVRAPAIGQSVVFYENDVLLGGGVISAIA